MQIKLKNKENTIKIYVADVRNVVVETERMKQNGKKENRKRYYSSLEGALKYIMDDFAFISTDKTIEDFKMFLLGMKEQLWKELEQLDFPSNEEFLPKSEPMEEDFSDDDEFGEDDFDDDEDWE